MEPVSSKSDGLKSVPNFVLDLRFLTTDFLSGVFFSVFSVLTSDGLNGFTFTFIGWFCGDAVVS